MDYRTQDHGDHTGTTVSDQVRKTADTPVGQFSQGAGEAMERGLGDEPANSTIRTALLAGAAGSILASVGFQIAGRKHEALFVGQWAPTLVSIALWYQIVKQQQRSEAAV